MNRPIIIVGAGRSGTNLLRDLICRDPQTVTWPCDEINPIWRFGNAAMPTDELTPEQATESVRRFVRGRFKKLQGGGGRRVVEKTCANCLRLPYVDRILPEAQYIHLIRDGRDVAASARRRWCSEAGLGYIMRKARFTPLREIPLYAWRFLHNRLSRHRHGEGRLQFWGPRFSELATLLETRPLLQVCGLQWARCVQSARRFFPTLPADRVFELRYEQLVGDPPGAFADLFRFLDLPLSDATIEGLATIRPEMSGKWRDLLSDSEVEGLIAAIGPVLEAEGYR